MSDETLLLDEHLCYTLNKLGKTEVLAAISLLQHRLDLMQSADYYLHIPITELPIPIGIIGHMLNRKILTVKDLLLCQTDQLAAIRGVGQKNLERLKKLIADIKQRKEMAIHLT